MTEGKAESFRVWWRSDPAGAIVWSSDPETSRAGLFYGVHPDELQLYKARFFEAHRSLEPYTVEIRARFGALKDYALVRESVLPIFEQDGTFSGYSGIRTLLADYNHPQVFEVRKSEERLKTILNNLPVLISYVDTNHYFRYNNEPYESYLKLPISQIEGRHMKAVIGSEAYGARRPYLDRALAGEHVEFVISTPHPEGLRYTAVTYVADYGKDGTIQGIVCLINDITSLKKAEEQLRSSEERYRLALEVGGIGTWEWNIRSQVSSASERLCQILEVELKDFPTTVSQFKKFVLKEDRRHAFSMLTSALRGGAPNGKFRIVTAAGRVKWLSASSERFADIRGNPVRTLFAVVDVTDQQEAILLREHQLQNEHQARYAAEYANRMKDQFLATLSHELRTPLHAIIGWSQFLKRPNTSLERIKEGLEKIERQALMQAQLVSDLLDMSGIISGKLALEMKPVDLRDVVSAAIDTVRPAAEAKQIDIQWSSGTAEKIVMGDWRRLQQVVWNILTNCIKFSDTHQTVEVSLHRHRGEIILKVKDYGIGISREFLPHIFDRFTQADSTSSRRTGGLGIGLALTRQLVESHHGKISAASEGEGKGTEFTLTFPLESGDSLDESDLSAYPSDLLKALTIMIVEDEDDARSYLVTLLEELGAKVTGVASSVEALKLKDRLAPDLIVSDLGLPEFDGFELMRELRLREKAQGKNLTPAIALSAFAEDDHKRQSADVGFQYHLPKPVRVDDLILAITSLVNGETSSPSTELSKLR